MASSSADGSSAAAHCSSAHQLQTVFARLLREAAAFVEHPAFEGLDRQMEVVTKAAREQSFHEMKGVALLVE